MGQSPPGPVTAEDVDEVVAAAIAALSTRLDRNWHVPAGSLEWDCWETVEHISSSLLYYAAQLVPMDSPTTGALPFDYQERRPGGPFNAVFANPEKGTFGLLRVFNACGGFLASMVRTASPERRSYHVYGDSDPAGFAAMGVVEVAVHLYDMAGALQLDWTPSAELCHRTVRRLFPDAPTDVEPWPSLLWSTGRIALPDRPQLDDDWRWYGTPR